MQPIRPLFALCLALVPALVPAFAQPLAAQEAGAPLPDGLTSASVRPGWATPEGARIAALDLDLGPGWKTYWRVPGEAGVPPVLRFDGSQNVAAVQVIWPRPEVFETNGIRTVGYHDDLVLPLQITPTNPDEPVSLAASLDLGICHEICVPVQLSLHAELSGPGAPDPAIAAALAAEPSPRPGVARCAAEPIRDGVRVTASIDLPAAANEVALFELRSTPMWVSDPQTHREGNRLVASAEFVPENAEPFDLDQNNLRITVVSAAGAVEIDGCPQLR